MGFSLALAGKCLVEGTLPNFSEISATLLEPSVLQEVQQNYLSQFPKGSFFEAPIQCRLDIAKLQWQIRHKIDGSMILGENQSFLDFREAIKRWKKWKIEKKPRLPKKLHDVSRDVTADIDVCGVKNNLPPHTVDWLRGVAIGMISHSQRVMDQAQKHPTPEAMFEAFTNQSPQDRVGVVCGPLSIMLRCKSAGDYATLCGVGREKNQTEEDVAKTKNSLGICKKIIRENLYYVVIGENGPTQMQCPRLRQDTFPHELTHAVTAFYAHKSTMISPETMKMSDPVTRVAALYTLARIQDERIAWTTSKEADSCSLFLGTNPPYDYLGDYKKHALRTMAPDMKEEKREFLDELLVKGRHHLSKILPTAEASLKTLLHHYPVGIVRELLRTEPITGWKKLADALTSSAAPSPPPPALR